MRSLFLYQAAHHLEVSLGQIEGSIRPDFGDVD